MGSSPQARYVDADKLRLALESLYPAASTGYSTSQVEQQINNLVHNAITMSLNSFKHQIIQAIDQASVPYDKCMLCVQRDSCIPEHPLGDNR